MSTAAGTRERAEAPPSQRMAAGAIRVRDARPEDMPWLLRQLRAFAATYGTKRSLFPSNPATARRTLTGYVERGPFFLAERGPMRVGFISGILFPHPFNPEIRVLGEMFWYVRPAHRGSSAAARLLRAFTEYGREHADWITFGAIAGRTGIRAESLAKHGYHLQELVFLHQATRSD